MTNHTFIFNRIVSFLLVFTCLAGTGPVYANKPLIEETAAPRRFRLLRPAMSDPADQLEHADTLRASGQRRQARRQYRALTRYWPDAPEAALAQYAYARLLEQNGRWNRAFEAYEVLLEEYSGLFPHDTVLQHMLDIAEVYIERRRGQFLFFPGFHAPERALPLLHSIVKNGPQWERAPEAQLLIGQINETAGQLPDAVLAYDRLQTRYPGRPEAEEAAFAKGRTLYQMAERNRFHVDGVEAAIYALALFAQRFPQSEWVDEAADMATHLRHQLAQQAYEKAVYYDRTARRPEAAIVAYERFLERYPHTEWSEAARKRLNKLQQKVPPDES